MRPTRTWSVVVAGAVVLIAMAPLPAAAQGTVPTKTVLVAPFGEVRTRAEWDRPGGGGKADAFTLLRSRFGVRIEPTATSRVVFQLQDSRVLGTTPTTTTSGADVIDLHQGYFELTSRASGVVRSIRAGRQEITLGNERLVGPVNWSNTGRSFDGVRISLAPDVPDNRWNITGFAAIVEERGRHFGSPTPVVGAPDHGLLGVYGTRRASPTMTLDATLLYDADASYRSYVGARRATLDARIRSTRPASAFPIGVELETAVQTGRQRYAPAGPAPATQQDLLAWLVGARVGRFAQPGRRTTFAVGADVLSGDATPADGSYSAFSTMYATNHPWYGTMDIIGDPAASTRERGLVDLVGTTAFPAASVNVKAEVHRFLLAEGPARPLGWEIDAAMPVMIFDVGRLEIGYSVFLAQAGAAAVGLAPNRSTKHWSFLQLALPFQ